MSDITNLEVHAFLHELSARMVSIGSNEDAAMLLTAANRFAEAAHYAAGLSAIGQMFDNIVDSAPYADDAALDLAEGRPS